MSKFINLHIWVLYKSLKHSCASSHNCSYHQCGIPHLFHDSTAFTNSRTGSHELFANFPYSDTRCFLWQFLIPIFWTIEFCFANCPSMILICINKMKVQRKSQFLGALPCSNANSNRNRITNHKTSFESHSSL